MWEVSRFYQCLIKTADHYGLLAALGNKDSFLLHHEAVETVTPGVGAPTGAEAAVLRLQGVEAGQGACTVHSGVIGTLLISA